MHIDGRYHRLWFRNINAQLAGDAGVLEEQAQPGDHVRARYAFERVWHGLLDAGKDGERTRQQYLRRFDPRRVYRSTAAFKRMFLQHVRKLTGLYLGDHILLVPDSHWSSHVTDYRQLPSSPDSAA